MKPNICTIDRRMCWVSRLNPTYNLSFEDRRAIRSNRINTFKFVAEVVSSNWQNDYSRKVEDYAVLGIPEYWIADYAGLGGTRHIGKPKQPTLSICTLVNGEYDIQQLQGNQSIVSLTFPDLKLTAEQVLMAGRS
jgi:Uma2 family endonuclease